MSDLKLSIRNTVLGRRRALSAESRKEKSEEIVDCLLGIRAFKEAATIGTYLPLKSEVDVSALLRLNSSQKCFTAPRTLPNFEMSFHHISTSDDLETGLGNVQQPRENARRVPIASIDLFLVPLAACDKQGNRLGFGKGYYDRALKQAPGYKLGVGFRCQLVDCVPIESHDIPLNGFVSEEGLIQFESIL